MSSDDTHFWATVVKRKSQDGDDKEWHYFVELMDQWDKREYNYLTFNKWNKLKLVAQFYFLLFLSSKPLGKTVFS